ncbi:MAG: hypothetical protein AcusKO_05590 [Acuticoccus sp.]
MRRHVRLDHRRNLGERHDAAIPARQRLRLLRQHEVVGLRRFEEADGVVVVAGDHRHHHLRLIAGQEGVPQARVGRAVAPPRNTHDQDAGILAGIVRLR